PKRLQHGQFGGVPGSGAPSQEKACGQAKEADEPENGKAATRLLRRVLREGGLVLGGIGSQNRRGVNHSHGKTAPKLFAGTGFFFARSQAERTNPGAEEGFQLVQGGAIGAAETTKVGGKTARPEREVGSIH